ncbi:MAG: hypothetical protein CMO55_06680 [Verrucomicrobiales bacterium]|nr:hypothetical protein [Verrucomicrobiales bacterium]
MVQIFYQICFCLFSGGKFPDRTIGRAVRPVLLLFIGKFALLYRKSNAKRGLEDRFFQGSEPKCT